MNYINENERIKCYTIIHSASIAAGVAGAGLCWLPMSDSIPISAAQITMAISLGKVFGIKLNKSAAKAAVAAAAATCPSRLRTKSWMPFWRQPPGPPQAEASNPRKWWWCKMPICCASFLASMLKFWVATLTPCTERPQP